MSNIVKTPLANYKKKNNNNETACGLGIKVVKTKLEKNSSTRIKRYPELYYEKHQRS